MFCSRLPIRCQLGWDCSCYPASHQHRPRLQAKGRLQSGGESSGDPSSHERRIRWHPVKIRRQDLIGLAADFRNPGDYPEWSQDWRKSARNPSCHQDSWNQPSSDHFSSQNQPAHRSHPLMTSSVGLRSNYVCTNYFTVSVSALVKV